MVQNKACAVILGKALKCSVSTRHISMFPPNPNFRQNMRNPKPFKEHLCKTYRYYNSPIPYLARILNKKARAATPWWPSSWWPRRLWTWTWWPRSWWTQAGNHCPRNFWKLEHNCFSMCSLCYKWTMSSVKLHVTHFTIQ